MHVITPAKMAVKVNGLSADDVAKFKDSFGSDPKNRLAQSFVIQHGVLSGSRVIESAPVHTFNTKVTSKFPHANPVTNQRSTGRCWMFSLLNTMRLPFMEKYNLADFEFSQSYLYFWDKIERTNYFLHAYISTRSEEVESRLVSWLLQDPYNDGGQWDMLVNLVTKYGIVPKSAYPECNCTENSRALNKLITNKLREFCLQIRKLSADGKNETELHTERERMVGEIYRICCIAFGTPPTSFDWEYTDRDGKAESVKGITPLRFYKELIRPLYNMDDKICLIHDPRPNHPFMKLYTVQYLGNIIEGHPVRYINVPIGVMKEGAMKALKNKEAVWFGCDVGKHFERKLGSLSLDNFDFELTFGVSVLEMNKAERLQYGESLMTHAMVLTGVHIEGAGEDEKCVRWQIENSWGSDAGHKGYLTMTDSWFTEFVYEVVVDKAHVSPDVVNVLKQEAVVLPPWDPMGALADPHY